MTAAARDIQAVAFDLDGLMFNTEQLYQQVGAELVRRRGHQLDLELLRQMMGRPGYVALGLMIDWYGLSDSVERLQEESDDIFASILARDLAPMPGLLALLQCLERIDVPKAIATSSRRNFLDHVLSLAELEHRFQFFLTAEDVTCGKPDPQIYQLAAERFGIPTQRMMVLEDSENGCRAAVAAGAYVVAIPGHHSRDHSFDQVHIIADSLSDHRIHAMLRCCGAI